MKLRDQIIEYVMVQSKIPYIIQERPYTAIEMTFNIKGKDFEARGFSKVKWPDKWDEEYGFNLACCKAAAKIAKQILESKDYIYLLEEFDEPLQTGTYGAIG